MPRVRIARTLSRLAGLTAVVLVTLAAACGGDSESAAPTESPAAPPSGAPATTETSGETEPSTTDPARTTDAAPAAAGGGSGIGLVAVEGGFELPVYVASTPSQRKRFYVVEQGGRIWVVQQGRRLARPFLDIRSLTNAEGERGLLSMAFHPDYAENRLFYVNYTNLAGDTRVAEYRSRPGQNPVRRRVILAVDQPYANHNGGLLQFGPDGMLYVGMGDGGSQGDPENRAQNLSSRLGKLLRGDVSQTPVDWDIVAYGLRNPWRFSFDRQTDDLYIADVGGSVREEVNVTPPPSSGVENYGWDVWEGRERHEDKQVSGNGELVFPVHEYGHAGGRCSITGGYVYRAGVVPAARGRYFFGDYCSGDVWSLRMSNGRATDVRRHFEVSLLSSFGEGARGQLYLVSHNGTIYRLARS